MYRYDYCEYLGVADGYESLCGCWEFKSGPLQDRQVLLTTEISLQAQRITVPEACLEQESCAAGGMETVVPELELRTVPS